MPRDGKPREELVPIEKALSENVIREAVLAGLLHPATVAMSWYGFQGGHVPDPPQLARWLALRTVEFETRLIILAAGDVADGRPLNDDDRRRVRTAADRLRGVHAEISRMMDTLAKGATEGGC